jgi:Zn-dependent peptidase ImmA (M78 family)
MKKEYKQCIAKFVKYICNELNIDMDFKVKLSTKRSDDLKTYAYYNVQTHDVKVYCKNRGMADVLRSVAHELVHHKQNKNGELTSDIQDVGGKIENEANSISGQLVKKFGYEFPDLNIYDISIN